MAAWKGYKTVAEAQQDPDFWDPPFDAEKFRARVAAHRAARLAAQPKPAPEPSKQK